MTGTKRKPHGFRNKTEAKKFRQEIEKRGILMNSNVEVEVPQHLVDKIQRNRAAKNPDIQPPPEIYHPVRARHWGKKSRRSEV